MFNRKFKLGYVCILVILLAFGCTTVNYIGEPFDSSTGIDTYFSEDDITREYTVIGRAIGLGYLTPPDKMHAKFIKEAKLKGADAILITGMGKTEVLITVGFALGEN